MCFLAWISSVLVLAVRLGRLRWEGRGSLDVFLAIFALLVSCGSRCWWRGARVQQQHGAVASAFPSTTLVPAVPGAGDGPTLQHLPIATTWIPESPKFTTWIHTFPALCIDWKIFILYIFLFNGVNSRC